MKEHKGRWKGISQKKLYSEPLEYLCFTFHIKCVRASHVKPSQNQVRRTIL